MSKERIIRDLIEAIDRLILSAYLKSKGDEEPWDQSVDFALNARNAAHNGGHNELESNRD